MYYQLEYDKVMVVDPFYYEEKNTWVNGLSLILRFDSVFESDSTTRPREQAVQLSKERAYLSQLVKVSYEKKEKFISFHEHEEIKGKYKVVSYYMDTCPKPSPSKYDEQELTEKEKQLIIEAFLKLMNDLDKRDQSEYGPKEINEDEFYFIINKYGEFIADDASLQNCSYSWNKIETLPKGTIIQNSNKKQLNQMTKRLEKIVMDEKERHDYLLSIRTGQMKVAYRSDCLAFVNKIEVLENKKEFLLNQEQFDQEKVINSYAELFREWVRFNQFIAQDSLYTS
ncbi:hypothetical protein ACFC3P_12390 [Enterococcus thailandicus]|uniref:hypothetical protein n=1 Tax=Enterococcus thailandicus TaxID=417368 RepID=UPI0039A57201